jgi:pimeloyl-ACP methyl ester carboxylesterase
MRTPSQAAAPAWSAQTWAASHARLAGTATAFASAIEAMFINRRRTNEALDSVPVPVLVLWGRDDPLVDPTSLRQHTRRPGWTPRPIDGLGHLLPVEAPDLCAQAVSEWLTDTGA